jgi:hypothetical protein
MQPECTSKKEEEAASDRRDADEITERLRALAVSNHVCLLWLKVTAASHCLNMLLSAVLIWYYYALDYRSYTVLITNVVAVTKMVASHFTVLSDPLHTQRTTAKDGTRVSVCLSSASLVKSQQLFFNRLDKSATQACC